METTAIADVLGGRKVLGKTVTKADDLAELVRKGLPAISIPVLAARLNVGNTVLSRKLGIPQRTPSHSSRDWRTGRGGLRVVVADTGKGIPADVRENVCEPFFTTEGESGTGLGLWISAGIVAKYEGTMRVWSSTRAGRSGTCFSVFSPAEIRPESTRE